MKAQLIAVFALLFISAAANASQVNATFDDPNNELSPMGQAYKDQKDCKGRSSRGRTEIRADGTSAPRLARPAQEKSST